MTGKSRRRMADAERREHEESQAFAAERRSRGDILADAIRDLRADLHKVVGAHPN